MNVFCEGHISPHTWGCCISSVLPDDQPDEKLGFLDAKGLSGMAGRELRGGLGIFLLGYRAYVEP